MADWAWLSPAGLLGLAALAAPVLIHLFSRSRGRRVLIGQIDLVRHARRRRVTEIRITQWLLLILRILVFVVAAMILAQLARPGLESTDRDTVYVTPAWLSGASQAELEALGADTGTEVFLLDAGFPRLGSDSFSDAAKPVEATGRNSIWPLLAERLSRIHHTAGVAVYSAGLATEFGDRSPVLPRTVAWHSRTLPLAYRPPEPRALILHDADRTDDAASIDAAFAALRAHRLPGLRWQTTTVGALSEIPDDIDWLVVLSARPLELPPPVSSGRTLTWLADAAATEKVNRHASVANYPFTPFELQRSGADPLPGKALWWDETGQAVLTEDFTPGVRRLRFASRFNESWSSLVRHAGFPEALLGVLLSGEQQAQAFAHASVTPDQLIQASQRAGTDMPLPHRLLQTLLALILVALWTAERWLSERSRHGD